jgi:hypothetical protein
MVCLRLLVLPIFFLLVGCSDNPEPSIENLAEKSKALVETARDLSDDMSERVMSKLEAATEKSSEKLQESVKTLSEQ